MANRDAQRLTGVLPRQQLRQSIAKTSPRETHFADVALHFSNIATQYDASARDETAALEEAARSRAGERVAQRRRISELPGANSAGPGGQFAGRTFRRGKDAPRSVAGARQKLEHPRSSIRPGGYALLLHLNFKQDRFGGDESAQQRNANPCENPRPAAYPTRSHGTYAAKLVEKRPVARRRSRWALSGGAGRPATAHSPPDLPPACRRSGPRCNGPGVPTPPAANAFDQATAYSCRPPNGRPMNSRISPTTRQLPLRSAPFQSCRPINAATE